MELILAFLFVVVAVFCIVWAGMAYGIVGSFNMISFVLGLFGIASGLAVVYLVMQYMRS